MELKIYKASDGKVFDWVNLKTHIYKGEIRHLYANTLFLDTTKDSIDNYIEVDIPMEQKK